MKLSLWNYCSRRLRKKYYTRQVRREEKNFIAQWQLRYQLGPLTMALNPSAMSVITPPSDRFYADPFVVKENGHFYIFFEEYIFAQPVGFISVIEISADGKLLSAARPVLQTPYHLSYPLLFKYQDQWLMMPESSANHTIEIWRCESFPDRWVRHAVLFNNIEAADSTMFMHQGRYWLLTALKQGCRKYGDKLFAFHADNPLSRQWHAHAQQPVAQGMLNLRPGGHVFAHQGNLIRPVQDSLTRYGGALEFRQIDTLSLELYHETTALRIAPQPGDDWVGIHTFNHCEQMSVIDTLYRLPRTSVGFAH